MFAVGRAAAVPAPGGGAGPVEPRVRVPVHARERDRDARDPVRGGPLLRVRVEPRARVGGGRRGGPAVPHDAGQRHQPARPADGECDAPPRWLATAPTFHTD